MVYYNEPHVMSEAELEIGMTVGYQIASGVERKRTETALRENEERLLGLQLRTAWSASGTGTSRRATSRGPTRYMLCTG